MKKLYLSLTMSVICFSAFCQWNSVGPEGISSGWSLNNDIAVDTTGNPVALFYERDLYNAVCLRFNGSEWVNVGNPGIGSFPVSSLCDFIIDNKNNYYLLFKDTPDYKTSCLKFDGTSWNYVGSHYVSDEHTQHQSLAVDNSGAVYVAFYSQSGFKIVKENGGNWQPFTTNGLTSNIAFPDMKFDVNNTAYLAYTDGGTFQANCAKLVNNTWVTSGNSNFSSQAAWYTQLEITQNQDIYVACDDPKISCYRLDSKSNTWIKAGVSGLGGEYNGLVDLISDAFSRIYISTSQVAGDRARCFTFQNPNWLQLDNSGISQSTAGSPAIAFSRYGTLYCTYNDFDLSKAVVKEFNNLNDISETHSDYSVKLFPNPAHNQLHMELPGEKADIQFYDMLGNLVYEYKNGFQKIDFNTEAFKKGVYMVKVRSHSKTVSQHMLIIN